MSVTIALEIIVFLFSRQCVGLFNRNPEVVAVGTAMMRTILPTYVAFSLREILYGVLRGHGYSHVTTLLSLVGMVGVRQLFLAVSMAVNPSIANIYWCYPVAWGSTLLLIYLYYCVVRHSPGWEGGRE